MEHSYTYALDSTLAPSPDGGAALSLATSGGVDARREPASHPFFFAGTLREPAVTAACLSTLSNVVASHFVADVVERLAQKDPVVTSGDGTLRFEGFSGCCGLYARLDLSDDALNAIVVDHGTTNVDFNAQMLSMLSRVSATDDVSISVGQQEVAITRGDELVRERKVKLPDRWLRGFAEAAVFQSRMEPALQLPKAQALRLLSSLPRGRPHDRVAWVVPSAGSGARFSQTRDPDGVQVRGIGRLGMLRALMRHVRQLTIFRDPLHEEVSVWQLDLAAQRMTVVLSPGVYRGFSGEGQVLFSLAAGSNDSLLEAVDEQLCWQSALSAQNVATLLDVSTQTAESALVCLGAEGLMGYDFRDEGFFHRELPFDREKVELRNPRLVGARELLKRNSVNWLREGQLAEVRSDGQIYRVELQPRPPHRCNCQWYAKYQGRRGTCKHILAVLLLQGDGAK